MTEREKVEKLLHAKDQKCHKCGKSPAAKWICVDPDIPAIAYCRDCLVKFEDQMMRILRGEKESRSGGDES